MYGFDSFHAIKYSHHGQATNMMSLTPRGEKSCLEANFRTKLHVLERLK